MLKSYFRLDELGTTVKQEIIAGFWMLGVFSQIFFLSYTYS